VPAVNWTMMLGTLVLTYVFGSSDRLAGAYGTAVSTTMLLTTALLFNAMRDLWRWPFAAAALASVVFVLIDLTFFGANLLKIADGGWIPLLLAVLLFTMMTTWHRGVEAIRRSLVQQPESVAAFLATLDSGRIARVPGTAVFFSRADRAVPAVLANHIVQFKALQQTVVSLTIRFEDVPRVARAHRAEVERIAEGFWHVTVRFGFVEIPNVVEALACAQEKGCSLDLDNAVYFAAHDRVVRRKTRPRLPAWQRALFAVMYRNGVRSPDRFDLPAEKFLEVGRQIAL
jgi:KUP system potassium uptake protein